MKRPTPEAVSRSLAAEVRAVEQGHHAVLQPGGGVRVASDTTPGKGYLVSAEASPGRPVTFRCRPTGAGAYRDDHLEVSARPGLLPCKHAAVAARRLEREGLAVYDEATGLWSAPGTARVPWQPADPFEGLPA